jgi:hypothetical protein
MRRVPYLSRAWAALLDAGASLETVLARGPLTIGGVYLGIHSLAFGAFLTLVGFNIVNLGVLTKTLMAQGYTRLHSAFRAKRFVFELGLLRASSWYRSELLSISLLHPDGSPFPERRCRKRYTSHSSRPQRWCWG